MIDRILKTYGEVNTTVKHFPPEKKSSVKYKTDGNLHSNVLDLCGLFHNDECFLQNI